ncbi:Disease resistance protein L6 [Linum perenne]
METSHTESSTLKSSSDSSSALPVGEYEVFLSFRGPDVRKTFADHLYTCLVRSKILTFRDDEELRKGETISTSIIQAITLSKIHIPVFSENYASSKWCLQEIAKMVECWKQRKGHVILPIFYFVNPRDVRHQEGSYKEAFDLHRERYDDDTVNEWREALREGAVIDDIVSQVDSHLMKNYKMVAEDLVGVDFHVGEVMKLLDLESKMVRSVSIHGIGGIGKTTLAKAVYDNVSTHFDRCCFVEGVRETITKNEGVVTLQSKVISSILREDYLVENTSRGIHVIQNRVCKHRVLIVLDDVDDTFEVDKILGKIDDFSPGSRFMFTTRDKVLNLDQECELYELGEMSSFCSLQLFSKHAFGTPSPPEDYVSLSNEFVEVAVGLPLALKVIGSLLFRKNKRVWEEKLMQLREVPASKVQERLKISYDALLCEEQQIFLDIACFFIGENKELPVYMWNDCKLYPESGVNALVLRSLIKINERNEFWMHDHIRDLGRAIVNNENVQHPCKRSRIWSNDEAFDMLNNREGTNHVTALKIRGLYRKLTKGEFRNLPRLRYLEVNGTRLTGNFEEILPDIRWIRLHNCDSVPSSFEMKKLVVLELENVAVTDNWRGWRAIKMAPMLKVITISGCYVLKRAPDLSECRSLELLNLRNCWKMSGELHIGNLKYLKELNIVECGVIKLTGSIAVLKSLKVMNFYIKKNFIRHNGMPLYLPGLPTSIKQLIISSAVPNLLDLKELEELQFTNCSGGLQIPGDIWRLSKLKTLTMTDCPCDSLLVEKTSTSLPSSLKFIDVQRCWPMRRLPSLANLRNLTYLRLANTGIFEIRGLGELRLLQLLHISKAPNLNNLEGLENLCLLTDLTVEDCLVMERLPSLATLDKLCNLVIYGCRLLTEIEGLDELKESLAHLEISGCPILANIESLWPLVALEHLELTYCESLKRLSPLWKLERLKTLIVTNNQQLHEIQCLDRLGLLLELKISGCNSLKQSPDLSRLRHLKELSICECELLMELTGLEGLESLTNLYLKSCKSITILSNLCSLKNLKQLSILHCEQLSEVIGIEGLDSLEHLTVRDCPSIKKLSDLSGLKNMKMLAIWDCTHLTEITGLDRLEQLESVYITGLKDLRELHIKGCNKLSEVIGFEGLDSLQELSIHGCTSITVLSDLSFLRKLIRLSIEGCTQLIEVAGIESLQHLQMDKSLIERFCNRWKFRRLLREVANKMM